MLTESQRKYLIEKVAVLNNSKNLVTYNSANVLSPITYGEELEEFIKWMYQQKLIKADCYTIEENFTNNYNNNKWYDCLSEEEVVQSIGFIIRQDRFISGFFFSCISDGVLQKLIHQLKDKKK